MIINRSCLCRIDRKILNQSNTSRVANHISADRCISSVKAVLEFIADDENLERILTGPLWWMLSHHLKRATTIILLGLSYRLSAKASKAEEILVYAKKAVNWLRYMAAFSDAAKRSWTTLSHLLRLTIEKIGGDTSDIISASSSDHYHAPPPSNDLPKHVTSDFSLTISPVTITMWQQQQGNYHYAFNFPGTVFGDQATWELDEFGFLQNPGVLNLYPGSTENTKNTVIGQEEDYPML
jgi:hypothetical protein